MPQFHDTLMGRKFYESIMPSIDRSLVSISNSLSSKGKDEVVGKAADDRIESMGTSGRYTFESNDTSKFSFMGTAFVRDTVTGQMIVHGSGEDAETFLREAVRRMNGA